MVVPLSAVPPSRNGFYAINNQFLANGPKGFMEFKMLENEDMYIRMDFPGVPENGVRVTVDPTKKAVSVFADAPKEHKHDSSPRNYGSTTVLACECCEISAVFAHMSDGVLRLLLTKTQSTKQLPSCSFLGSPDSQEDLYGTGPHKFPHGTDPHDPALTGRVLQPHPCVNQGPDMAYESKQLENGSQYVRRGEAMLNPPHPPLYLRVDMPDVPKDRFTVSGTNGIVMVTGEAPAVSHDSGGRFYSGDVAMLASPIDIPSRWIKTIAKNGVIRLIIPPV